MWLAGYPLPDARTVACRSARHHGQRRWAFDQLHHACHMAGAPTDDAGGARLIHLPGLCQSGAHYCQRWRAMPPHLRLPCSLSRASAAGATRHDYWREAQRRRTGCRGGLPGVVRRRRLQPSGPALRSSGVHRQRRLAERWPQIHRAASARQYNRLRVRPVLRGGDDQRRGDTPAIVARAQLVRRPGATRGICTASARGHLHCIRAAYVLHARCMLTACGHLRARSACMRAPLRCEDQRLYEAARADAALGGGAPPRAGEATRTDGRFVEAEQLNYVHRRHPRVHCAVPCGPAPRAHRSPSPSVTPAHPSRQPPAAASTGSYAAPTWHWGGAGPPPGRPWRLLPGSRHGAGRFRPPGVTRPTRPLPTGRACGRGSCLCSSQGARRWRRPRRWRASCSSTRARSTWRQL